MTETEKTHTANETETSRYLRDGERVDDLDQINLPDPVMNAIQQNEAKINALQAEIEKLKEQLK